MTRLDFKWPDASGEAVAAARGRLAVVGERLVRMPFEDRLHRVADVVEAWSCPDSPWRRELSSLFSTASPFHRLTLQEGLEAALRAWDRDRFIGCARREIGGTTEADRLRLAPFATTSVLAGGAIPMPTILSGLLPLVLGSPVLLRETSKDSITGELLARSIADESPDLAGGVEAVRFPVEDTTAMDAFLASPCVVATGSDATIAAITSRLASGQRFVAYGHRFSIAILGPRAAASDSELEEIAEGLALDVARWDQLGCLSPVVVYLVGLPVPERQRIASSIASALDRRSTTMPRGTHSPEALAPHAQERAEVRMRAATNPETESHEGADFTLTLEPDDRPRPAPLGRFLRLCPTDSLESLERALVPYVPHLSSAAVAGFLTPESGALEHSLLRLGVSRSCRPGRLQTPPIDWPHDGLPLLLPMARFARSD